jgi:hypothetical protein
MAGADMNVAGKKDGGGGGGASSNNDGDNLPETMNLTQAHKFLGVSMQKMTALVGAGKIEVKKDPLDGRVKLVRTADLRVLKERRADSVENASSAATSRLD